MTKLARAYQAAQRIAHPVGSLNAASIFFFQAEDGIRDLYVTGVQTCALPILTIRPSGNVTLQAAAMTSSTANNPPFVTLTSPRSEESRVGKECRSRWSAY